MRPFFPIAPWGAPPARGGVWVRGHGGLRALAELRRIALGRLALLQAHELLAVVEGARSDQAGRLLRIAGGRIVDGLEPLAAGRGAVEALDRAEGDGPLERVRLHVRIPALPHRPRRVPLERAVVDDPGLGLVALAAEVAREVRCAVREEARDRGLVEVEVRQDRVELREEHVDTLQQRL